MKKFFALFLLATTSSFSQIKDRELIWAEDFNGTELNLDQWNIVIGNGCPELCGFGNNELQVYTDRNYTLVNGLLTITARKEGETYTSTKITSAAKKEFQYGYIEIRAKLPTGHGVWPAFWMLGTNIEKVGWPLSGEIDILEYVGREPTMVFNTLHTQASHGYSVNTKKTKIETIEEGFHTFGVDWTKDKMDFYVDGTMVYTFIPLNKTQAEWPFDQPFYFLLNLAIGGNFGGAYIDNTIFPQDFTIDYIKVYSQKTN